MVYEERWPENVNLRSQELRLAAEKKINQTEREADVDMIDTLERAAQRLSLPTGEFESKSKDYKEKVEIVQEGTQEVGQEAAKEVNKKSNEFDQVDSTEAILNSASDSESNRDQTGQLFKVKEIPLSVLSRICLKLNTKDDLSYRDFRLLGEKMGFPKDLTKLVEQKSNPTYELLQMWDSNRKSTVENLLMILKDDEMGRWDVAIILEDWLKNKKINN